MDSYDSDEDGAFDILRRSIPVTPQDIEAQLTELRRLGASIKYDSDSPKRDSLKERKIAKQKIAIDSQIQDLEMKLEDIQSGKTLIAVTRSPQLRGSNRQLVRPGSRLSSVRENFGTRPTQGEHRRQSGSGSDLDDMDIDPFPSCPISEVTFSEVEIEGMSSTSFDPRHPAAHAVDQNLSTFFMSTGLFPQDLCINFQSRTIVKRVEVISFGVSEMTVTCSDSHIKRTSFAQGETGETRSMSHTYSDESDGVVAKHTFNMNLEHRCRMLVLSIEKGFADFCAIYLVRVYGSDV